MSCELGHKRVRYEQGAWSCSRYAVEPSRPVVGKVYEGESSMGRWNLVPVAEVFGVPGGTLVDSLCGRQGMVHQIPRKERKYECH